MAAVYRILAIITIAVGTIASLAAGASADSALPAFIGFIITVAAAISLYTIAAVLHWLAAYYALAARKFEQAATQPHAETGRRAGAEPGW